MGDAGELPAGVEGRFPGGLVLVGDQRVGEPRQQLDQHAPGVLVVPIGPVRRMAPN
jgi:hypothetical protein